MLTHIVLLHDGTFSALQETLDTLLTQNTIKVSAGDQTGEEKKSISIFLQEE